MINEIRYCPISEFRIDTNNEGVRKLVGYAAVFDKLSVDLGGFREKIEKNAFRGSIETDDIRALWNHDRNIVLGRNRSGTLKLEEDDHGLKIEITPPDTQAGRDAITSIERGDVDQMSFGFQTITDDWQTIDKDTFRTLKKVRLLDVSPVSFPAYPDTEVEARSSLLDEAIRNNRIPQPEGGAGGEGEDISQGRYIETLESKLKLDEEEEKEY